MNDAHSARDAAGGPGRDRRPEDPYEGYDPYDPLGQDPYGQAPLGQDPLGQDPYGQYQQQPGTGQYGQDPYGAQPYQQPAPDPYGQGAYGSGEPGPYQQPDGYGYDPYGGPQQPGHQEPHGGARGRPRVPPQGYQGYDTGPYDTGQYETGQYDTGQYDTGQYDTGGFTTGAYPAEPLTAGGYPTGEYDTGGYPVYPQDPYAQPQQAPLVQQDPQQPQQPSQQPRGGQQTAAQVPRQGQRAPAENPYDELGALDPDGAPDPEALRAAADYKTEQFSFVDDEEEDEEVIDWLKFAETRTERRDERKRRGRNRVVALGVVLALALVGGLGYLWARDGLPFLGEEQKAGAPVAGQKRDVIVVHLKELDSENSSTALLVNNETTGKGATVLVPNALAVSTDDAASTTLGKSVDTAGAGPTRDGLSALLGADIKGTWRLDTPFLELLVESLGGVQVDTDATVRGTGKAKDKTLVEQGEKQTLNGAAAVAYATHRGAGEAPGKQLARFGRVMESVLKKLPSTPEGATGTVTSLGQVPDPSLPDAELGASLAPLAEQAKTGRFTTLALPVQPDGTLDESATKGVVKDILGGTVKNSDPDATPSVRVQDATGREKGARTAQVDLVNSGYTFVEGGRAKAPAAKSTVEYSDPARAKLAKEVADTLGLPGSAVRKASGGARDSQIRVVLGQDYQGGSGDG